MKVTWPPIPTLLLMGAALILVATLLLKVMPIETLSQVQTGDNLSAIQNIELIELAKSDESLTKQDKVVEPDMLALARRILSNSPFHKDRAPYSRFIAPPPPPKPELNPEVIGVLGRSENRRVMIVWQSGRPAETHRLGDKTPWGILIELEQARLVFEDDDKLRELDLFGR